MEIILKELFDIYPLSVSGVAEKIGMNRSILSRKVNGTTHNRKPSKPTPRELEKIEEYLHELGAELQNLHLR